MPYIERDTSGNIKALHKEPVAEGMEFLAASDPQVEAFLEHEFAEPGGEQNPQAQADVKIALSESDADIARVTEDLVYLLIKKNVILFTELPTAVQDKLLRREKLRAHLQGESESFLLEDDAL